MIGVDVGIEYAPLTTVPLIVNEVPPIEEPVAGGVVVDIGVSEVALGTIVVSGGVRAWSARWDTRPSFDATVWSVDADASYRMQPAPDALVSGWWSLGGGLRGGLLAVDRWDDVLTFGVGGSTGAGVVVGRGPLRATASVRASVTLDVDRWDGVVQAHETTSWSYWPGSARVYVSAGAAFR